LKKTLLQGRLLDPRRREIFGARERWRMSHEKMDGSAMAKSG
jgi:hypothetical protein